MALKLEENETHWSSIFNSSVLHNDEKDRNKGVDRYTSSEELLVKQVEDREDMPIANVHDALNVWLGWTSTTLKVDQGFPEVN